MGRVARLNKNFFSTNLYEMTVDLPPAQDELSLLVADLLQTLQLFERAGIENVQDFLSGVLQHRCFDLGLPGFHHYVLFTIWKLRDRRDKYSIKLDYIYIEHFIENLF